MSRAQNDPPDPNFHGYTSPNYTQVPDELFDRQLPDLSGAELKVLLYIMRRTFGFKKDADDISLNQICHGITTRDGRALDRGTGLSKSTAQLAIKGLLEKNIILTQKRVSKEKGNEATTFRLNLGGPYTENRHRGAMPEIGTALYRKSALQETVIQETDEDLSKFERSHDEQFADAGASRPPTLIGPERPELARDASEPAQGPDVSVAVVSRPTGPENASQRLLPPPLASQRPPEGTSGRRARQIAARPILAPAPVGPAAAPPAAPSAPAPSRRRPRVGTSAERDLVGAFLGDFNAELLHDDVAVPALVTQAINIFRAGAIPLEQWPDYLYQARTLVKERAGAITKVSTTQGERKNRGPYYFAVLRDLVAGAAEERSGP